LANNNEKMTKTPGESSSKKYSTENRQELVEGR
jgi:hypothetical protein